MFVIVVFVREQVFKQKGNICKEIQNSMLHLAKYEGLFNIKCFIHNSETQKAWKTWVVW